MQHFAQLLAATAALALAAAPAHAAVTISSAATQNMSCSGGVCAPTANRAVLNVGDLETLLASGNVTVKTTGSGVEARDIKVRAPFGWAGASVLMLDAYKSMVIDQQVSISGTGGLAILTGDGGTLEFGKRGKVSFANISSELLIDHTAYRLENNIKSLAYDIARKPNGAYALASDYDASGDGVYPSSPIGADFTGAFSGLGNVILHLTIVDNAYEDYVGLFRDIAKDGVVAGARLSGFAVAAYGSSSIVGGLVGLTEGVVSNSSVRGRVIGYISGGLAGYNLGRIASCHAIVHAGDTRLSGAAGGLVSLNDGTIIDSWSGGSIRGFQVGGLAAENAGAIQRDFSTASVISSAECSCGGLIGLNAAVIADSFATGKVSSAGNYSDVGGLVGYNFSGSDVTTSYSTGAVEGVGSQTLVGGFFGTDQGTAESSYWDTDTSGTELGSGDGNESGITGLTTTELQSGLPAGFDPAVWAENPGINGGLPYLLTNPPPK